MHEEAREKAAAEIHERALLYSESQVYRLNNQYLSERQKVDVEMWFVAPIELFYIGLSALLLVGQPLLPALLISSAFSIGFMEYFYWHATGASFYPCHRFVLGAAKGHVLLICLLIGSVILSDNPWWIAILVISVYFLTALSPSIMTSVILHGTKMHPKYAFARRRFSVQYPWDSANA